MDQLINMEELIDDIVFIVSFGSVQEVYYRFINNARYKLIDVPNDTDVLGIQKRDLDLCIDYLLRQEELTEEILQKAIDLYTVAVLMCAKAQRD